MKKRIFLTIFTAFILAMLLAQSVFAVTRTEIITPEYNEDTVVAVSFKDGQTYAEYVYTGNPIKPEIVVTKVDKTIANPSEYTVTYDDNCHELGAHFITVEYLKSGYIIMLDYRVVPGKTEKVDMTAKNGNVTLSWAAVKGATCYRVYEYNASKGKYVEIPWEDGSIAAPKLSRTFTNLEAGKTYNMGIMALEAVNHMPTKQMKTFKFTVPESGEGNLNIVPGINATTKPTATKVAESQTTITTTTTQASTTELNSIIETTSQIEESSSIVETTSQTETLSSVNETTTDDSSDGNPDANKIIPVLISVAVIILAIVSFWAIKKKKK